MARLSTWDDLLLSLWDHSHTDAHLLPGCDPFEWIQLAVDDWNEMDCLLHDYETIGV